MYKSPILNGMRDFIIGLILITLYGFGSKTGAPGG